MTNPSAITIDLATGKVNIFADDEDVYPTQEMHFAADDIEHAKITLESMYPQIANWQMNRNHDISNGVDEVELFAVFATTEAAK